jgi:hypothetical protein
MAKLFGTDAVHMAVLIALVLVSWIPRLGGPIDLRGDGGIYYILGTSLAEGKGYRLLNEPGEIEVIQYPPVLPLIVAAHQRILGTSDVLIVGPWLRVFYLVLYVGFTVAVYWLARLYLSPVYALLAASVCMLDVNIYYLSDLLYTELPFALLATVFAITNRQSHRIAYSLWPALLGIAAYLLRTAGIALLAAWVVESLLHGRSKQMVWRLAVALVPILLWQSYIAQVKDSQQYRQPAYAYQRAPYQYANVAYAENMLLIKPFRPELGQATAGDLADRLTRNLTAMPSALGESLSAPIWFWELPLRVLNAHMGAPVLPLWPVLIPLILLGCLMLAGMVLLSIKQEWFIPLYCAASLGLIALTPFPEQFPRYLTPLTPFLALSLFAVLASIRDWGRRWGQGSWKKAVSTFSLLVMMMIFLVEGLSLVGIYIGRRYPVSYTDASGNKIVHALFFYYQSWRSLDMSLEWLQQRASPEDVIATTWPHWAYLRTGLKAVIPPMVVDGTLVQPLLDSVPVKYIVLDDTDYPGISQRYVAPAIEQHLGQWRRVYGAPGDLAAIYERVR